MSLDPGRAYFWKGTWSNGFTLVVKDGVNGLHFRVGDPVSLATAIKQAVSTNGLWDRLRDGIPPIHSLEDQVQNMSRLYRSVVAKRQ